MSSVAAIFFSLVYSVAFSASSMDVLVILSEKGFSGWKMAKMIAQPAFPGGVKRGKRVR
jgi:hypothetical protein